MAQSNFNFDEGLLEEGFQRFASMAEVLQTPEAREALGQVVGGLSSLWHMLMAVGNPGQDCPCDDADGPEGCGCGEGGGNG